MLYLKKDGFLSKVAEGTAIMLIDRGGLYIAVGKDANGFQVIAEFALSDYSMLSSKYSIVDSEGYGI